MKKKLFPGHPYDNVIMLFTFTWTKSLSSSVTYIDDKKWKILSVASDNFLNSTKRSEVHDLFPHSAENNTTQIWVADYLNV